MTSIPELPPMPPPRYQTWNGVELNWINHPFFLCPQQESIWYPHDLDVPLQKLIWCELSLCILRNQRQDSGSFTQMTLKTLWILLGAKGRTWLHGIKLGATASREITGEKQVVNSRKIKAGVLFSSFPFVYCSPLMLSQVSGKSV